MKIIKYVNGQNIDILFPIDGTILYNRHYAHFKNGKIANKNYKNGRVGEENYNVSQKLKMTIIEYIDSSNITVLFEDGTTANCSYSNFKKGSVLNKNVVNHKKLTSRIGEESTTKYGTIIKIIEYKSANDIIVEFQDAYKYKTNTTYWAFRNGAVKNPYDKSVFGVGYLGVGRYVAVDKDGKTDAYNTWKSVLNRCYGVKRTRLSYKDVTVCEEWHNFQNFAKWYEENYYKIDDEAMNLDKDILVKGNKIYSPNACIYVPKRINLLFVKNAEYRNGTYIGVIRVGNKYRASLNILEKGNSKIIGNYNTELEAFNAYKEIKERYIKQVADEYKDRIPEKLYNAMYQYQVEITD